MKTYQQDRPYEGPASEAPKPAESVQVERTASGGLQVRVLFGCDYVLPNEDGMISKQALVDHAVHLLLKDFATVNRDMKGQLRGLLGLEGAL